jgi:hypothetical protein
VKDLDFMKMMSGLGFQVFGVDEEGVFEVKTAKLMKDALKDFRGSAALYQLSTPMVWEGYSDNDRQEFDYVVVSSAVVPFSGPETYIFGADKDGKVLNWSELPGSRRGSYSHADVLREAGYEATD